MRETTRLVFIDGSQAAVTVSRYFADTGLNAEAMNHHHYSDRLGPNRLSLNDLWDSRD